MTRLEALERAEKIWGLQIDRVVPAWRPGEWMIELVDDGRPYTALTTRNHRLDRNGHATCHQECADCEVQVT